MQFPKPLRTPVGAAFLSFVFPGLGQWAAGAPRRAAIVSIPAFSVLAAFVLTLLFDRSALFSLSLNQGWLTNILIVDILATVYHVWAIVDAWLLARPGRTTEQPRPRTASPRPRLGAAAAAVIVLVAGTVTAHGAVAKVDTDWQHALYCLTAKTPCWVTDANASAAPISTSIADADVGIDSTDSPGATASGPHASPTPMPTIDMGQLSTFNVSGDSQNWAADGELNVLLLGLGVQGDASSLGPDTIMVLHSNISTGAAELVSIGRNNYCTPLPTKEIAANYPSPPYNCPAGTFGPMLFNIPNEILGHCGKWPIPEYASTCGKSGDENRYLRAYKGFEMTIGSLLGIHVDGSMWINPVGLTAVIDALGGVNVTVTTKLYDKPCGPAGTKQQQRGAALPVPGTATCSDTSHWGYFVPTGPSGIQRMKELADTSNGGLAVYTIPGQPWDVGFVIKPGTYKMNGDWALAYARTRIYDPAGDFGRQARQQNLLSSMRKTLDPCTFASVGNVLPLLNVVQAIPYGFNTDMDITDAASLKAWANLAKRVLGDNLQQIVLSPKNVGMTGYAWDAGSIAKARDLVKQGLLKTATPSPGTGGGASTC